MRKRWFVFILATAIGLAIIASCAPPAYGASTCVRQTHKKTVFLKTVGYIYLTTWSCQGKTSEILTNLDISSKGKIRYTARASVYRFTNGRAVQVKRLASTTSSTHHGRTFKATVPTKKPYSGFVYVDLVRGKNRTIAALYF